MTDPVTLPSNKYSVKASSKTHSLLKRILNNWNLTGQSINGRRVKHVYCKLRYYKLVLLRCHMDTLCYSKPLQWPTLCHTASMANARASCAEGRKFETQRSAKSYTALQTARHCFNIYAGSCVALAVGTMTRRWVLPTRYTLRRNTASIMKVLVL